MGQIWCLVRKEFYECMQFCKLLVLFLDSRFQSLNRIHKSLRFLKINRKLLDLVTSNITSRVANLTEEK
jgi:hypothetical protein